jgi:TrmH family RNA methyltransferase
MTLRRYKHDDDVSYTLGMTLTIELFLAHPQQVEKVYLSTRVEENDHLAYLKTLCKKHAIPVEQSEKAFHILSPKKNCFVIGVFRKYDSPLMPGNHIVLVNPADSGNLGTILRTAAGFAIPNIAIIRPAIDIFDPKVVRASMGALFRVNFRHYEDFGAYKAAFPAQHRYAFMLGANTYIEDVHFEKPFSLIFGNEASGLPEYFADLCKPVVIGHTHIIDSQNLPIAAGIAMFVAGGTGYKGGNTH